MLTRNSSNAADNLPVFCGPSSSDFALNVAATNLEGIGVPASILEESNLDRENLSARPRILEHVGPFGKALAMDPLWDMKKQHALNLIRRWFDTIGSIYPILERDDLTTTAENVFKALDSTESDGLRPRMASIAHALLDDETNKMKLVLAIGRIVEAGSQNDQASRLLGSTTEAVGGLLWNSDGVNGIQLLVLVVSLPLFLPPFFRLIID